jgi:uncharacterized protein YggE
MKRISIFTIALLTAAAALAQTPQSMPEPMWQTITVTGNGEATVTPDRVTFTAGVQTVEPTVEGAVNQNNSRVAAVVAALKKAGATDKEIRTSNFSINPQQQYNNQGQLPRIIGYQVSNNITVTRSDLASAGKLLQVAVSAGVNQVSGLNFEVSDPSRGRDAGLQSAFTDARSKAAILAQAAGRTLGRALSISEGVREMPPRPMPMAKGMVVAESVSEIPVESGAQIMNYTVTVVFELR